LEEEDEEEEKKKRQTKKITNSWRVPSDPNESDRDFFAE
jgi:hypothetical protein